MSETTTPSIIRAENNFFIDGEKVGFINPSSEKLQMLPGMKEHRPALESFLASTLSDPDESEPDIAAAPKAAPAKKSKGEIPPCPEMDPFAGDKTPAVVEWFFKYKPEEAKERYKNRRYTLEAVTLPTEN